MLPDVIFFIDSTKLLALHAFMNTKRFFLAFLAMFVFTFFWGWLLNGVLLKDIYAETPNLWRPQSEMMGLFHWIVIGQVLLVFAFVMIYSIGFASGGVAAGIKLGILARDRGHRYAISHLCGATFSGEADRLRQHQRPDRNDHCRRNRRRDLQTKVKHANVAPSVVHRAVQGSINCFARECRALASTAKCAPCGFTLSIGHAQRACYTGGLAVPQRIDCISQ